MPAQVNDLIRFLARPNGGIELEFVMSAIEFAWGVWVIMFPDVLETSQMFSIFLWHPLPRLVGAPWLIAGTLNIIGLFGFLFFLKHSVRAFLRGYGAIISAILWWTVAIYTGFVGGSAFVLLISFIFALAYIRVLAGAWQRITRQWREI